MRIKGFGERLWMSSPKEWCECIGRKLNSAPKLQDRPLFWCLSTGRVGSQTLAALGALATGVRSVHEPTPLLYGLSRIAYEAGDSALENAALVEAVRASRIDSLKQLTCHYIETSPQTTFLGPVL